MFGATIAYHRVVFGLHPFRNRLRQAAVSLVAGVVLLAIAWAFGSWFAGLIGIGALAVFGWAMYSARQAQELEPWVWPLDARATAEAMARRIDPVPRRVLPLEPDEPHLACVASTSADLDILLAGKPPLWRWAVFASVLVQRRNAVQPRLRDCALGYHPRTDLAIDGQEYSRLAWTALSRIADRAHELEQFMLSPAFRGAFGTDEDSADADSIVHIATRLMDYHEEFIRDAETCLQTRVDGDAMVFAQDAGALAMCPLIGYDRFIVTMCDRVAEAQELLPYVNGQAELVEAKLGFDLPDGLLEQVMKHIQRFNP